MQVIKLLNYKLNGHHPILNCILFGVAVHGIVEGIKDEFRSMDHPPNIRFTTVYPFSCNTGLLTGIKSHSRFPWLVPKHLDPQEVAAKVVEGLRRNYELVYIPGFVQFAGTTAK